MSIRPSKKKLSGYKIFEITHIIIRIFVRVRIRVASFHQIHLLMTIVINTSHILLQYFNIYFDHKLPPHSLMHFFIIFWINYRYCFGNSVNSVAANHAWTGHHPVIIQLFTFIKVSTRMMVKASAHSFKQFTSRLFKIIFFSLCTYITPMDVMLDFICMGLVDLSGARREAKKIQKWKIIAHSGTRTHNPEISSLMLYQLS